DSGGAGKFRGGLGIERVYQFLAPAFITFSLERKATPPWGLGGGRDGAVNGVEITSPDGSVRHVRKATQHPIAAGETVCIMSGGGAGWGPPAELGPGQGGQIARRWRVPVPQALAATCTLRRDLAAGTTTMRIMGEEHFVDVEVREDIEDGVIVGPRLLVGGRGIAAGNGQGRALT